MISLDSSSQNGIVGTTDYYRIDANRTLNPRMRGRLGQYMTQPPVARYMAGLFKDVTGDLHILDPGAGVGSLTAAFVERCLRRNSGTTSASLHCYEIDRGLIEYLSAMLNHASRCGMEEAVDIQGHLYGDDFIHETVNKCVGDNSRHQFTHVIMNPPYRKFSASDPYRAALRRVGLETSNLYTAFLYLAAVQLRPGGELVAIVPRSFCNGPYFKDFRKKFLSLVDLSHVHLFKRRDQAFKSDDVLQENIIIHAVRERGNKKVIVSTSHSAHFQFDRKSGDSTTVDLTQRAVLYSKIVAPESMDQVIHLQGNEREQGVTDCVAQFEASLRDLDLQVSTGPVVGFRVREYLCENLSPGAVPLLYPAHFKHGMLHWPTSRKPNAIMWNGRTRKWLFQNRGHFVVVRRFSTKEERRRIVASVYSSELSGEFVGFENYLNVFHINRSGFSGVLARGICIYLNSSLVDQYFRQFSGHTQVNAADLRIIPYPDRQVLERLGEESVGEQLSQNFIDKLITKEAGPMAVKPLHADQKIQEATRILKDFRLPPGQQNERSALTLLALLDLSPSGAWQDARDPLIGITPIMDYCRQQYGTDYAPNTRETFRRQTMHQFVQAGLALHNPDDPARPVNSPKTCYQISPEALDVVRTYGSESYPEKLLEFLAIQEPLVDKWAKDREMEKVPVVLADGKEISLSPGKHNQLIKQIIGEFAPRFIPGAEVVYIGDTEGKMEDLNRERLRDLGVQIDRHGKMPDVVLYFSKKNWLILVESVTTHGPVDAKRHEELTDLFSGVNCGVVFVTAFPDRKTMAKYLVSISWETEVWCADSPTHLIHFDGERFLGPYNT